MTDKMETAANIVRELHKIDKRLDTLTTQRKDAVAALLGLGFDSGKHITSAGPFTVSAVNAYDEAIMRANLAGGQFNLCKKVVLDRAKVKALYPAVYALAKVENGQKVTL